MQVRRRWQRLSGTRITSRKTARQWEEFLNGQVNVNLIGWKLGDAEAVQLAEALRGNATVTTLYLHRNQIGVAGVEALAEAIKVSDTLTFLSLVRNQIGDTGAIELSEALRFNETVTEVQLAYNQIGDAGATALAEALKINRTVAQLHLSGNQIGVTGAAALADALKVNSTVEELQLGRNQVGDAGAAALAEALKFNSTLTKLHLMHNQIRNVRTHEITFVLTEQPARARGFLKILQRQHAAISCWSWLRKRAHTVGSVHQSGGASAGLSASLDIGGLPEPFVRVAVAFLLSAARIYS